MINRRALSARVVAASTLIALRVSSLHAESAPAPSTEPGAREPARASFDARFAELSAGSGEALTADETARRARAKSHQDRAKQAALVVAAARVDQALVALIPKLTLTGRYTRLSPITQPSFISPEVAATLPPGVAEGFRFPVILNQYLLQATLAVPLSDYVLRLTRDLSAANRSRRAAELDLVAQRRKTALDARLAYYSWVRAKGQEVVSEQSLEQSEAHLVDVRSSVEGGVASTADLRAAEAQLANSELLLAQAKNLSRLTEEQVRIALQDAPDHGYLVGEDLRLPVGPSSEGFEELCREALRRRPELQSLAESAAALREQASSAYAARAPRLDAVGNVYYQNPNQRYIPQRDRFDATWDVGVQLSWSPGDALSGGASGRDARARAEERDEERAALRDALRVEVLNALQACQEAEVAIKSGERAVAAAEEAYRVRRELFQERRAISVELTDAENELLRARLVLVNGWVDARVARAKLSYAVGRD